MAENAFGPVNAPEISGSPAKLSLPPQDLSRDPLVTNAPWVTFAGALRPAFGSIPLVAKLGQGGMGAVYFGFDLRCGRLVSWFACVLWKA